MTHDDEDIGRLASTENQRAFARALKPRPDHWPTGNLRPGEQGTTVEKLYLMGYSIHDAREFAPVIEKAAEHPGMTMHHVLSLLRRKA